LIALRIFEGDGEDETELSDITIKHNATFILCASLEHGRPIAHGKLHQPQNIPSLQGVNFAGANYLDRPAPAAYFVFPDLSVRNEGWYRLNFSLLEGVKDARDAEPGRPFPPTMPPPPPSDGQPRPPLDYENMAVRLDVRSQPFQVFSAKKFPGLAESTDLSRMVAEQGCRVRIRRDVRMRRSDRRKDDYEAYDEGRRSTERFVTPDNGYRAQTPLERQRSLSRTSLDGSQYGGEQYRRLSDHGYRPGSTPHGSAAPSPRVGYPVPRSPLTGPPGYGHQLPPPTPLGPPLATTNGFAMPQPRRPADPILTSAGAPPESRPQWQTSPNPVALPRSITPDLPPPAAPSLPPVSSIHALTNPTPTRVAFDETSRLWRLPEPSPAAKRGFSPPPSDPSNQPLKGFARPDTVLKDRTWVAGAMDADPTPYAVGCEDKFLADFSSGMRYRRANGTVGVKHIPVQDNDRGHGLSLSAKHPSHLT